MKKVWAALLGVFFAVSLLGACGANTDIQSPQNVDAQNFIGEDKAKEIALAQAGISADGVVFDRVELDFDDSVWQYEVEFRKGSTAYDADIKAEDGTVLRWETDAD